MITTRFTAIDDVACAGDARIYPEGWQSWSPTTWYPLHQQPHRPDTAVRATMRHRPGLPPPPTGFQGEGLLVLEPGGGAPALGYSVEHPTRVPTIRAELVDGRLLVSTNAADPATIVRTQAPDGPTALALFGDRLARAVALAPLRQPPTAWCSWYRYFEDVTPRDMLENLAAIAEHELPVDVIQLDDGWQRAVGDWTENHRFAALGPLADRIRAEGRRAGIWLAPFLATPTSDLARRHPEWLAGDAGFNWHAPLHGLDLTRTDVCDCLWTSFRRLADLGFDYFKLDFLYGGLLTPTGAATDAYRAALSLIRDAVGPTAYLVGCGAPILPTVGLVDAMRVSPDTFHPEGQDGSTGLRGAMAATARAWQHGRLWVNDADCLVARPQFPLRAEWADLIRAIGGLRSFSDRVCELDDWGLATVRDLLGQVPPPRPLSPEATS